jgi:hypothetical protein
MSVHGYKALGMLALLISLSLSSVVTAGQVITFPVAVTPGTTGSASGSLTATRYSADTTSYIGCYVQPAGPLTAVCYARDVAGDNVQCTTSNADHIKIILSLNSISVLTFSRNTDGTCNAMQVMSDSAYIR